MDAPLLEKEYLDWYLIEVIGTLSTINTDPQINNEILKLQSDVSNIYSKINELNKRLDDCKC
jgi:hypothetical protein